MHHYNKIHRGEILRESSWGLKQAFLGLKAKSWELDKMSLFQSALDFLAGPGSSGAASRDQNDFVGQVVELGDMKLRIKRVIAEGKTVYYHEKCC